VNEVEIIAVSIPIVAILSVTFLIALKIVFGGRSNKDRDLANEETRLIQDVYHGLLKMEERVEALETLLLDREKRGDRV
jgi:phage shock protein B